MSNSNSDSVKRKIIALLNISKDDSASQAELETALKHAQKLMEQHHLSEDDLAQGVDPFEAAAKAKKDKVSSVVGKKTYAWECGLAFYVQDLVGGVKFYRSSSIKLKKTPAGLIAKDPWKRPIEGKQFVFYGIAEDAEMASLIYDELRFAIIALSWAKHGSSFKGDGGKYSEGFVYGLGQQLKQRQNLTFEQSEGGTRALILQRDQLIKHKAKTAEQWLSKECGINLSKGSGYSGASGSSSAFSDGRADGSRYDVSATRRKKLN